MDAGAGTPPRLGDILPASRETLIGTWVADVVLRAESPEMSAITHLIAGVPVSDLDAGIDWYTRFFGRAPDMRAGEEILWDMTSTPRCSSSRTRRRRARVGSLF